MAGAATTPSRSPKGRFTAAPTEPPVVDEPVILDPLEDLEAEEQVPHDEAAVVELDPHDIADLLDPTPDNDVDEEPPDETEVRRAGEARVQALLTEALRLGTQYGLVRQRPDGSLTIPSIQPANQRETSECTCPRCGPHNQLHWWCMVCNSGPHDWLVVKPQFERQTLKPGGIEGVRHAACSAQCARDYMLSINRQPSGIRETRQLDPTLALPMTGT